jgi:hypothetical protein
MRSTHLSAVRWTSGLTRLKYGVEALELDADVGGCKAAVCVVVAGTSLAHINADFEAAAT